MKLIRIRTLIILAVVIVALGVGACTSPEVSPTPAPAPTATSVPATAAPAVSSAEARSLLASVADNWDSIASFRSEMKMAVAESTGGVRQTFGSKVEVTAAAPDAQMKVTISDGSMAMDFEVITKDNVTYVRSSDEWTISEGAQNRVDAQATLMDLDELKELLAEATTVELVGKRDVHGVECEVVKFSVSPDKMLELVDLAANPSAQDDLDDFEFSALEGEVAIGVDDKLVHQYTLEMSGHGKTNREDTYVMTMSTIIWDVNAQDIVIEAPTDVKPATGAQPAPESTPTPAR
jgi:hypothetical protein